MKMYKQIFFLLCKQECNNIFFVFSASFVISLLIFRTMQYWKLQGQSNDTKLKYYKKNNLFYNVIHILSSISLLVDTLALFVIPKLTNLSNVLYKTLMSLQHGSGNNTDNIKNLIDHGSCSLVKSIYVLNKLIKLFLFFECCRCLALQKIVFEIKLQDHEISIVNNLEKKNVSYFIQCKDIKYFSNILQSILLLLNNFFVLFYSGITPVLKHIVSEVQSMTVIFFCFANICIFFKTSLKNNTFVVITISNLYDAFILNISNHLFGISDIDSIPYFGWFFIIMVAMILMIEHTIFSNISNMNSKYYINPLERLILLANMLNHHNINLHDYQRVQNTQNTKNTYWHRTFYDLIHNIVFFCFGFYIFRLFETIEFYFYIMNSHITYSWWHYLFPNLFFLSSDWINNFFHNIGCILNTPIIILICILLYIRYYTYNTKNKLFYIIEKPVFFYNIQYLNLADMFVVLSRIINLMLLFQNIFIFCLVSFLYVIKYNLANGKIITYAFNKFLNDNLYREISESSSSIVLVSNINSNTDVGNISNIIVLKKSLYHYLLHIMSLHYRLFIKNIVIPNDLSSLLPHTHISNKVLILDYLKKFTQYLLTLTIHESNIKKIFYVLGGVICSYGVQNICKHTILFYKY